MGTFAPIVGVRTNEVGGRRMTNTVREVLEAYWRMQNSVYENGMDMSDFSEEDIFSWVEEILKGEEE